MSQVAEIAHEASGTQARVLVSGGFNLFSWTVPDGGVEGATRRDLIYSEPGFSEGRCRPTSGGIPLMFPFAGRIAGGKFHWNGRHYELPTGDGRGHALHGFAFNRPWRLIQEAADSVTGEFQLGRDAEDVFELWPGDFSIRATYQVGAQSLDCGIEFTNTGDEPLPCCFGWHPYFRLPLSDGGSTAKTTLTLPASQTMSLVEMIPTGKIVANDDGLTLPDGFGLGEHSFDEPFVLDPPNGSVHVVTLRDNASGRVLKQSFDASMKYAVAYTPGHREAICVEPQTGPPDIFNMQAAGLSEAMLVLASGESKSYSMKLEWLS